MNYIFNGKDFALKKEEQLKKRVEVLKKLGKIPKLATIIVGDDPASVLYVSLKKKAAERVGCELEIISCDKDISKEELINKIEKHNNDELVTGIMVQLPLPDNYSKGDKSEVLDSIYPQKDVDGLRSNSEMVAPATCAVLQILEEAINIVRLKMNNSVKVLVVGSSGHEGTKIFINLSKKFASTGVRIIGADTKTKDLMVATKDSDVIISATGVPSLIKPNMVKEGVVLIDVGSPKGDIDKESYSKASFVSPVPGGVGPMTISCLLENLVNAVRK